MDLEKIAYRRKAKAPSSNLPLVANLLESVSIEGGYMLSASGRVKTHLAKRSNTDVVFAVDEHR